MNAVHLIAQTSDTVTLSRIDYERMLEAIEDAEDIKSLHAAERESDRADYLPVASVMRLMAGEHPLRIWREHRALSPQLLAQKANVSRSYLIEIEGRKKPGSITAYRRLAAALGVTVDDLLPNESGDSA